MKKITILALLAILLSSCNNYKEEQVKYDELKNRYDNLEQEYNALHSANLNLENRNNQVSKEVALKTAKVQDKKVHYVLKLSLRQVSYSLSIGKQLRDVANTVYFEVPVDEDFYNHVHVGDNIQDNFRFGSLILGGSFGDWRIKVKDKRTEIE